MLFFEPVEHRNLIEVFARTAFEAHGKHGATESEFFTKTEPGGAEETFGEVKGCGEKATAQGRCATARFHEEEFAVKLDAVYDTHAAVEVEEVNAALE